MRRHLDRRAPSRCRPGGAGGDWYFSRRVQRSVAEVSRQRPPSPMGDTDPRVAAAARRRFRRPGVAFNQMAIRLNRWRRRGSRLFGDLAHEIRTPVAVLEAYFEAVEDGVKTLTARRSQCCATRPAGWCGSQRTWPPSRRPKRARLNAATSFAPSRPLVETAYRGGGPLRRQGVTLTSHVDGGLPLLWADRHRLGQVVANLLDNALRHTSPGGRVNIAARRRRGTFTITVTDDGEGIPAEHLPRCSNGSTGRTPPGLANTAVPV